MLISNMSQNHHIDGTNRQDKLSGQIIRSNFPFNNNKHMSLINRKELLFLYFYIKFFM